MAFIDFVKLYAKDAKTTPEALLAQEPRGFALTTNERGAAMIDFFRRTIDYDFAGKRVLDVGCAYGGFSLALAKAGAHVEGIDVSPQFIAYAEANARGVASIKFQAADASSVTLRKLYPKGWFDLVVLNDVLEHIYDTASLLANLDWLLNDKGLVFFKVPNGYSPRFILLEGHRRIFGLPLLDPDCWFYLYPQRASIFYRTLGHYQGLFTHCGFGQQILVDEEEVFRRFTPRKFKAQIKEIFEKVRDHPHPDRAFKQYLRQGLVRFRDEYFHDLETSGEEFVKFKYGSYFFYGLFGRSDAAMRMLTPIRELPGIGRIAGKTAETEQAAA
jgi:SAM-dependent methyltransferase